MESVCAPPHMDTESPSCFAGANDAAPCKEGSPDPAGKGPPRVASYSEMDTRPPLTPDTMMALDVDSHVGRDSLGDPFHMQELLSELPTLNCQAGEPHSNCCTESDRHLNTRPSGDQDYQESANQCSPCPLHIAIGKGQPQLINRSSESDLQASSSRGLFMTDDDTGELLSLFQYEGGTLADVNTGTPLATLDGLTQNEERSSTGILAWDENETPSSSSELSREDSSSSVAESEISDQQRPLQENNEETLMLFPHYPAMAKVPGPCEPDDLLDGVVFGARYLGSTQLECARHQMASTRMRQAQEAVDRVKAPDGESQPMTEVDVMVSTKSIKVLTANTQEALMDHPLQTISYTADVGSIVVIMVHRKLPRSSDKPSSNKRPHRIICHVFQSEDAQLIAQAIGQAFALAYHNFLQSEGVEPEQTEKTRMTERLYNADLAHFTKQDNCKEVCIQKQQGEVLGVTVVESGWGSLLPTVVIANLMHGGPAERCGELSIGDHVISVNGTSLVGLPFSTCQELIRELKCQSEVTLRIVHCPPVVTAIIHRPNTTYQLGFCVEDGVICSLVRGGIAEKGGIRVGHRIIEINGQSVVATSHDKIIQTLLDATGEVQIKTMPASTYRLLTGQETPTYL
ncbi:PREDICTED: amyloid beta A4 precursor protein-binding family A member 3-like [Nanorana parkeri]|uniref:amyloid beta A4 precursor protein-binding family A member 3-like n=1 Tax=Nanorana parkeri TaxID=125878 RepID=UPI0008544BF3|nr:PREDICTED: amyloid beta A4 precursor protein-binding family A member 3-like [Nanorana parkeri]